jgi:hypothetical protein
MGSQLLPISQSKTQEASASTDKLIREWLFRFGVEHKEDVAPKLPLWLEAFGGMDAAILERLFGRALRACKFFPKVSEILEPLATAEANAAPEAAEVAWARILEIRRVHWNPDIPGPFDRALARLSDRVRQAARAAGVFRDFTAAEFEKGALHTWGKKRFVESFIAYGELEQDEFLLSDGEIKRLLAGFAQTQMLPAPSQDWSECRARGEAYRAQLATQGPPDLLPEERLRIADELAAAARKVLEQPREHVIVVSDEAPIALRRQAESLKRSFPMRPEAFSENPTLRKVYERFGLEIPEPTQTQGEPQKPGPVEVSA